MEWIINQVTLCANLVFDFQDFWSDAPLCFGFPPCVFCTLRFCFSLFVSRVLSLPPIRVNSVCIPDLNVTLHVSPALLTPTLVDEMRWYVCTWLNGIIDCSVNIPSNYTYCVWAFGYMTKNVDSCVFIVQLCVLEVCCVVTCRVRFDGLSLVRYRKQFVV